MPLRLHSLPGQTCPMNGSTSFGGKASAVKGLGAKAGAGTGLGLGPCGTAVGKAAVGVKSPTPVVWSAGAGAGTASGHGISLGLGLGLGAWGPVLLGAGIAALGYYLYANRDRKPAPPKDELAAALDDSAS